MVSLDLIFNAYILAGVGMQTSDVRPLGSEGYIGETQTSDQRNNSEVPKGRDNCIFLKLFSSPLSLAFHCFPIEQ